MPRPRRSSGAGTGRDDPPPIRSRAALCGDPARGSDRSATAGSAGRDRGTVSRTERSGRLGPDLLARRERAIVDPGTADADPEREFERLSRVATMSVWCGLLLFHNWTHWRAMDERETLPVIKVYRWCV